MRNRRISFLLSFCVLLSIVLSFIPIVKGTEPNTIVDSGTPLGSAYTIARKVFQNPRGQKFYYVMIYERWYSIWAYRLRIYKSADGLSWSLDATLNDGFVIPYDAGKWIIGSLDIAEGGDRLHIYFTFSNVTSLLYQYAYILDDSSSVVLSSPQIIDSGGAQEWRNPVIAVSRRTGSEYVFIAYVYQFIAQGNTWQDAYVTCTDTTFPTDSPTWETTKKIYDAPTYLKPVYLSISPLSPQESSFDVVIVWSAWDGSTFRLYKINAYETNKVNLGTEYSWDTGAVYSYQYFSVVCDDESPNPSEHVAYVNATAVNHRTQEVDSAWGAENTIGVWNGIRVNALSVVKNGTDRLRCFWRAYSTFIEYKSTPVTSINWVAEGNVTDTGLSSSIVLIGRNQGQPK